MSTSRGLLGLIVCAALAGSPCAGNELTGPQPRGDQLILKTMNRKELLEYILDGFEKALPEFEGVWKPQGEGQGYWHLNEHRQYLGDAGGAYIVYALLLVDRPQAKYCGGKYSRELLLERCRHFQKFVEGKADRYAEHTRRAGTSILYDYLNRRLNGEKPDWPPQREGPLADAARREQIFRELCGKPQEHFTHGLLDGGFVEDLAPAYWSKPANVFQSERYFRHLSSWLLYHSVPQDRAVHWAKVEGHSLAEIRAHSFANFNPDHSGQHHDAPSWAYLQHRTTFERRLVTTLFAAAVAGRKIEDLPPPLRAREFPELANYARYVHFVRRNINPVGHIIWPFWNEEYYQEINLTPALLAYDACVNRDGVSAAYLSRAVQNLMWQIQRPAIPKRAKVLNYGNNFSDYPEAMFFAYTLIKHWGLPEDLPDWHEAQTRAGGVTFHRYHDTHYHHNPYKLLQVRAGGDPAYDVGRIRTASPLTCNFSPAPFRADHTLDFLQPGQGRDGRSESLLFRATHLFGDYHLGEARWAPTVGDVPRRFAHWDDGFRLALEHEEKNQPCRRALFSLGGRVSVVLESSPLPARLAPMNFKVHMLDFSSRREGLAPKVRWTIATADRKIPFASVQFTEGGEAATVLSERATWYNIDDLLAVAVPEPTALRLSAYQFPRVRDTLFFGPTNRGAAIVYAGVPQADMADLAKSVRRLDGLPKGWEGLKGLAPEGYGVFAWVRFTGDSTRGKYAGREAPGAPVFSVPTRLSAKRAEADIDLAQPLDTWSEEPHFYVAEQTGAAVRAQAFHHRLELKADGPTEIKLRFLGMSRDGDLEIKGTAGFQGKVSAAALRGEGITLNLKANQQVWLTVHGDREEDRLGPYVDITAPRWLPRKTPRNLSPWQWQPIKGRYVFKADAADRSGVAKVEFYLNNGQLIGTATQAPFECAFTVEQPHCQFVYAIAYDRLGNRQRSFSVPFGDGRAGE
jgi:hypothetical protein